MNINTGYYNYYNVQGRYTTEKPQTAVWKEKYEVVDDRINSNNYDPGSDAYKAYIKLEEVYYAKGVSNRARYSTTKEVKAAIYQKYFGKGNYSQCSYDEKSAMYTNELNMTLYGCLKGVGNQLDPHLKGVVEEVAETQSQEYNRETVNMQLSNIFAVAGIDNSLLSQFNMTFSIDPYDYSLEVTGVDDAGLVEELEKLLNQDNNSRELFYHILKSNAGSISENVMLKYHTLRSFVSVTGENPKNYHQTENGLVNEKGEDILNIYWEALKTSDAVPALYQEDAYDAFAEGVVQLLKNGFSSIPDLYLSIGYQDGMLLDLANENVMIQRFDIKM